jgi:KUP system potassium uptake protein
LGALLLERPDATQNPFFHLGPAWLLAPLVGLATLAAIIASQTLISGAFSLTRQAVQLGYLPRVQIVHTSSEEIGQIYVPGLNWFLCGGVIALCLGFKSSSALASAYGVAVTLTMAITSVLSYAVARRLWHWPVPAALALFGVFLLIDLTFFSANAVKLTEGGWLPLTMAAGVFTVMTTWKRGREILADRVVEIGLHVEL